MARIFLSHTWADKPTVRHLKADLVAAGHAPWIDEDEVLVGESIPTAVARGLQSTDYVIVCLSAAALASGWVETELDLSVMRQFGEHTARVLPARLEPVKPPVIIGHLLYVDLFPAGEAYQRGVEKLLRSIAAHHARAAARKA